MEKKEQEVAEEYLSSLADLNLNSKPLINMLTILAEENIEYAPVIVKAVEQHIAKVSPEVKLPVLYLIDSIVKNVGRDYITLFSHRIVNIFCGVFEKVNEKIREKMYTLRQTWNDVFPPQKLYALDVKVNCMDPNWPITAKVVPSKVPVVSKSPSIHVNPNFLKNQGEPLSEMEAKLRDKQRQLLELQKRKLELELAATKQRLEEQEKQLSMQTTAEVVKPINLNPELITATSGPAVRQQMFAPFRPPQHIRPGMISNQNFMGYPPNATKPRIAPVNPNMISSLRHRDPRLARQQQQQQQQEQYGIQQSFPSANTIGVTSTETGLTNSISMPKVSPVVQSSNIASKDFKDSLSSHNEFVKKYEDKNNDKITNRAGSNSRSSSYHGERDKSRNNTTTSSTSSSGKRSKEGSYDKSNDKLSLSRAKSSSRSGSSSSNDAKLKSSSNSGGKSSNEKDGRFKEKTSASSGINSRGDDKKKTSISKNSNSPNRSGGSEKSPQSSSRRERSPKKSSTDSLKHSSSTSSPTKFKETKQNAKSRNFVKRDRDREKCSSPASGVVEKPRDVDLRTGGGDSIPDKRLKLDEQSSSSRHGILTTTTSINSISNISSNNLTGDITTSSTDSKDLEKNIEAVKSVNKDVDLRQFPTNKSPSSLVSGSNDNMQEDIMMVDIETKKRQFVAMNKVDEPAAKKSKSEDEKIDSLFGKEDVDLRNLSGVPPHHIPSAVVTSGAMPMTPPPPPIISNESENWAKVKGSKPNKVSPTSNFDDVRAKLAKATRTHLQQKLDKCKDNKKSRFSDVSEDSSDGTDANIRTIISQAQELLASENINLEQYNTLVKTVIQINETSKLKEAQRRELQNNSLKPGNINSSSNIAPETSSSAQLRTESEVKHESENIANTSLLKAKSKALQKRIPKLPKDTPTTGIKVEQSSVLQRSSPPISSNTNYMDTRNISSNTVKLEKRGGGSGSRQKESNLWNPWDQAGLNHPSNQNQNKPWINNNLASNNNMNRGGGFNQKLPPANFVQSVNQHYQQQNRLAMPNPWNNPPPMIFAGGNIPSAQAMIHQLPVANAALSSADKTSIQPITQFCNSVDNPKDDVVRTINIDGVSKEIRVYDEVAVVFMDWDQPREIGFQGGQRRIIIDDQDPITLNFNDVYTTVTISNKPHNIRFGCPSRELYIDDNWYECCFGGPPIAIPIDGKISIFKIEGPPPQVNIGNLRQDLVVGKINLIIDARILIPVFLDSKIQSFELDGRKHTLQFANNLKTVLIDGESIDVEYGGLPKSLFLSGSKYFVRFGTLPNGIIPGKCHIKDMICTEKYPPLPPPPSSLSVDAIMSSVFTAATATTTTVTTAPTVSNIDSVANSLANPSSIVEQIPFVGPANDSDIVEHATAVSTVTETSNIAQISQSDSNSSVTSSTVATITGESKPTQPPILPPIASLNIDELFQKLLASGILNQNSNTSTTNQDSNAKKLKEQEIIRPIDLSKSETIKTRQAGIVQKLFSGMQCSSCGLRFPPEQTMKYSQHLDWHFRQNRRERDSSRKAHSRKWYYDVSDWIQYEEIEDIDEREKNWFEAQQNDSDNPDDSSNPRMNSPTPTCPAGPDDVDRACDMCHDKFEQFYNEESEEWHLKSAIRVDDKIYHPLCYQDYKASLTAEETTVPVLEGAEDDNATDTVVIIKEEKIDDDGKSEIVVADDEDDDDVIVLPAEEPLITEIPSDDEEDTPSVLPSDTVTTASTNEKSHEKSSATENEEAANLAETTDKSLSKENLNDSVESDVEIQEPNIPFTDLDTYVEKQTNLSENDESSQQSSSRFTTIKIKEEPKDSDNEDDAFEDVGTFISIDDFSQSVDEYVPHSVSTTQGTDNLVASIDGNVDIQDTQTSTNIGVNKIKINITKNITTSGTHTSSTTTSTSSGQHQKAQNIPVIGSGSAIPVICNFNKEFSSTTIPSTPNNLVINLNTKIDHTTSSQFSEEHLSSHGNRYEGKKGTTAGSNNGTSTSNTTGSASNNTNKNLEDDGSSIEYELKPQLVGIEFKKMSKIKSGYETSGLCSIM